MNNKGLIKSFSIKGLFGTTDVKIPFDSKVKILIGENGIGKTQVLNMLYYTLTKKFERLIEFTFDSLEIIFNDGDKIKIEISDIEKIFDDPDIKSVIKAIGIEKLLELRNLSFHSKEAEFELRRNPSFRKLLDEIPISSIAIFRALDSISGNSRDESFQRKTLKDRRIIIDNNLQGYQILYFPTYRRVEEDLRNLGYDEDKFAINKEDTKLIHFGMDDVNRTFKELSLKIQRLSTVGLSNISGEILSQLVEDGMPDMNEGFLKKIDNKDIEIIFDRAGNNIKSEQKERIKKIVETGNVQEKDKFLLYFLQKLINIYDQQRELDDSIKLFRDVCNKYLVNKKVVYDESKIEIYIQADGSEDKLQLSKLSSGEKQILSTFSKVYLASPDCKFLVLFDEPELSLSIEWQRNLLPDIYNSGKCDFLFAVTHSPFIFDNDLDKYAIGLNEYLNIKPLKPVLV